MRDHLQKSAGRERRLSLAIRTRERVGKRADAGLCTESPRSWAPASRCRFEGLTIPKGTPPSPLRLIPAFFRLHAWTGSHLPLSDSLYSRIPGPPLMVRSRTHSHLRHSQIGPEPVELIRKDPVDSDARCLRAFNCVH